MSIYVTTVLLAVIGTVMGSFAGATVWRLRARQLREDAAAGEKVTSADGQQVRVLKRRKLADDRSQCLHCGHALAWYDLVPLASWLWLRGKCRYCRKPIGYFEPLMEIGVAVFFACSFLFWPYELSGSLEVVKFSLWLIGGVGLAVLFAYDAKWFLLPNVIMFPVIGVGVAYSAISVWEQDFALGAAYSVLLACSVLSGLYYVIYVVSKGAWIGFGDIKLGLALALLLADWRLALLTLFLANLIGALVLLPFMIAGKITRKMHVPFGPFLIAGWFISGIFGLAIIDWYLSFTLSLV